MPLTEGDRKFLQTVDHLKFYILIMAFGVLVFLLLAPKNEIQMATAVLGIALCGVFWLTQRLLSFITSMDVEMTRVLNVLKRTLPEAERKELFRE
jgi:predicted membrane channel-forming protein YqfA (hemolysin III family)